MSVNTSDLDFNDIKQSLRSHLKKQTQFADYDFEASGLSSILDVLAYNTHINGLIANMAINESFLSSAQLRGSVVAHAAALGYQTKSRTASKAVVTITTQGTDPALTIPAGTEFFGDVDQVTYSFKTTQDHQAFNVDGTFTFEDITIREGSDQVKTFIVDSIDTVYVIPDENIDTSTIIVNVYDNFNSTTYQPYVNVNDVATITDMSRVYIISEVSNGYYELTFSDGNVLGQCPQPGNKIVVQYVRSSGSDANGVQSFETNDFIGYSLDVATVAVSAGGSEKESMESIKKNAPRNFAAQQRLVTADDYESLILTHFNSYIKDVIAWGGNDNVPPQYGNVFVSLNFFAGTDESIQQRVKQMIINQLSNNLSIMSIDTKFVEPQYTLLEFTTVFNLDITKTGTSLSNMEAQVDQLIENFVKVNLDKFDSVFRRSLLTAEIDNHSPAILNSRMSIKGQQRISLEGLFPNNITYVEKDFTLAFPFPIAVPDKDTYTVTTSSFKYNGENVYVRNELGSTKLQIVNYNNDVRLSNVGSYNPSKGLVMIEALPLEAGSTVSSFIKVSVVPANQSTIRPLRNCILGIDKDNSFTSAVIDTGSTKVLL